MGTPIILFASMLCFCLTGCDKVPDKEATKNLSIPELMYAQSPHLGL